MIWQSAQPIIVIFLLIGMGVLVAGLKWVSRDVARVFSKVVINLAVPGTLVYNFSANFTRQQLLGAWLPLLVIFLVMPLTFFVGRLFAALLRIPQGRRGVFAVLFSLSNSMFIGFPVAQALFGDPGMPYAVFYYLANTTVFWTLGYLAIRSDADILTGSVSRVGFGDVMKKLITPPIITVVVMFIIVLTDIKLPDFMLETSKFLGGMTTPLSLVFTGCMLYYIGPKGLRFEKGMASVLIGRFVLIPALCFGVCMLAIAFSPQQGGLYLMRDVFTVQMGLPAMMQTTIVAELYGADVEFATKNVLSTTLFSLLTIPAYMILISII